MDGVASDDGVGVLGVRGDVEGFFLSSNFSAVDFVFVTGSPVANSGESDFWSLLFGGFPFCFLCFSVHETDFRKTGPFANNEVWPNLKYFGCEVAFL